MIKLDLSPTPLTVAPDPDMEVEAVHRLIVLVPTHVDTRPAARRIWELAQAAGMHILLLGLYGDAADEPGLRRELISLSAFIRDARVSVDTKIEIGKSWLELVKCSYRPGDMIVCQAEQRTGLLQQPLSQILESNFEAPIYILSGLTSQSQPGSNWLSTLIVWAGSIGIVAGGFLLQIQLVSIAKDWAQTTLLILSVMTEIWLIGVWNSRFR